MESGLGSSRPLKMERDWELVCRVCLGGAAAGGLVSLFDCDENRELLKDKYLFCSNIEVLDTEPLPSHICLNCVDRLLSAYQFKQQCISSYDTLKECLSEFQKSNLDQTATSNAGVETVTIKREDGAFIHYEIPIEEETGREWPKIQYVDKKSTDKQPKRNRGRPRKYPNMYGMIEPSPYNRKRESSKSIEEPRTPKTEPDAKSFLMCTMADSTEDNNERPESPMDDGHFVDDVVDPEYLPDKDTEENDSDDVLQLTLDPEQGSFVQIIKKSDDKGMKRKGRSKKSGSFDIMKADADIKEEDDVLLQETIMANSAPIPDSLLNPQPKDKKRNAKKTYKYDRVHTCDQCGSSFRSNASLQAHIRRHLGIKPFTCSLCGYSCVLNMELRRHMMRHTGLKPYKCRICDRYFGDFGSRQKHERLHMGVRPYQCTICGKSFTYSYVLSNHMLTHTGEKKYSCAPCCKRFTKAHHLKYHNKIHHKETYLQQQLIQEAKKIQHINISDLTTVCTEQLLGLNQDITMQDGTVQIQVEGMDSQEVMNNGAGKSMCLIDNQDMSDEKSIGENIQISQHIKVEDEDDEDLM